MAPADLFIASLNFTYAESLSSAIYRFAADRSLVLSGAEHLAHISSKWEWKDILHWLTSPDHAPIIMAWCITFTVVMLLILSIGFGPGGVVAGSCAAMFQSYMYGGFTPAGGIFAALTSMAMLGTLAIPAMFVAALIATGVALIVWRVTAHG
ncbi:hypothetical protein BJY04DRAFT_216097 [Aspergillus karnatakaensis]|uniref:uncharacterized protein n=1 Tax=Aspergillus karnatakaensis TaxID=1810916 RepID=UPI003CCD95D6